MKVVQTYTDLDTDTRKAADGPEVTEGKVLILEGI
jgi:hypothetical protein